MEFKDYTPLIIGICLLAMGLITGGIIFYIVLLAVLLIIVLDLFWLMSTLLLIKSKSIVRFEMPRHEWHVGSDVSISTIINYSGRGKYRLRASQQVDGKFKVVKPLQDELVLSSGSPAQLSMELRPIETGEITVYPLSLSFESRFFRDFIKVNGLERANVAVGIGYAHVRSTHAGSRVKKYFGLLNDALTGIRGGTDFYNIRAYVSGDELKNIDWARSSKAGRLIVKEYEESRVLPVFFLIDVDASMGIGSGISELNTAINLMTNMANKLLMDNAMFGLISFSRTGVVKFRPLGAGREHMASVKTMLSSMQPVAGGSQNPGMTVPIYEADTLMKAISGVEGMGVLESVLEETFDEYVMNVKADGFVRAVTKASQSTGSRCQIIVITNLSMGIASLMNGIRIATFYGHSVSVVLTPHIWYQNNELIDIEKFYEKYLEIKSHISRIRSMGRVKVIDLYSGEMVEDIIYRNVSYGPAAGMRR